MFDRVTNGCTIAPNRYFISLSLIIVVCGRPIIGRHAIFMNTFILCLLLLYNMIIEQGVDHDITHFFNLLKDYVIH